ncbi:MAG: carbonic anhydrase [Selenomonas ruminantium]|nr:carbonic anhydrase [Selenomonas ruminantium]
MIDYKNIIKSRKLRRKILRWLSFVPDDIMLKLQYKMKTGKTLDLNNPQRYTEKIQWYKLYYKNPLMIQCVDKSDVREYVKSKGLEDILIRCYGVYDSANDIDWTSLPNQFVMKDTLGGGGSSVLIIKDKRKKDIAVLTKQADEWTRVTAHTKSDGREWPYYSGKKHRIIIEEYIESDSSQGGLIDYKFLCFNGKAELIYILADRVAGQGAGCGFFDLDFKQLPITESDEKPLARHVDRPKNFQEMIRVAEKLSEDFPCARIDLYNDKGKIIFGEITFYDSSGYMIFNPDSFDYELGDKFIINKRI